ncbi:hypothetical protein BG005_005561 [Podila minutissima]|nr:hypothetical protein BG005_005561 [Podila minutissima]
MELLGTHFQESARRAAGSFLSPLTNAIGEQRRLVESLAVVSKVRVEECKHMMVWSKSQTDDVGDVLLKLNLLIRKISDYEIRFGSQYEGFREKIKYLRTKDDSLCEMGRRQADLQAKILEASKSKLRSAKARLLQSELDNIQKDSAPAETELQRLKRELIKAAYTEQLNAIIELGKKMQIIGDHGKQLLEHIDLPGTPSDGRKTEDILQSARITLESWDKLVMVNPEAVVVHPPPAISLARTSTEVSILAVSEAPSDSDSESSGVSDPESNDDEEEFAQAPSTPLKAKASLISTKQPSQESLASITTAATVVKEASSESESSESEEEEEAADDKEIKKPDPNLLQPFASTLAPKLTLTPQKPASQTRPPLPARNSSDWASEATQALASVHIKKGDEKKPAVISEEEALRQREEQEMKKALELSLAEPQLVAEDSSELKLTAEEIRFVMGDIAPKRSTKIAKRQARAPETTDGDSPAVISAMRRATRRAQKEAAAAANITTPKVDTHIESTDSESDDEKTPTAQAPRVRGPQLSEASDTVRVSQQGPRPWNPEEASGASSGDESEEAPEELASATDIPETMGDKDVAKPVKVIESMGPEPEKPLESMGPEPEKPLESMGPEPERTLESMGHDGPDDEQEQQVPFVPMPQMPSLDGIREQKIQERMHQERIQQQRQSTYAPSPELQYLPVNSPQPDNQQVHMSPQPMNQKVHPGSGHSSVTNSPRNSTYQSPIGYQPSTQYVPSPKQKNRLSGSHTPPQGAQGTGSLGSSPRLQHQQQYQQQYQQQQYQSSTYSAEYIKHQEQQQLQYLKQQQQQLQDFYYSPYEQEYQQQQYQQYHQQLRQHQRMDSVSSVSSIGTNIGIAPLGWNLPGMAPPQVSETDLAQYSAHHHQQHHQHASHQQQQQQQQQPAHGETSSDSQSTGAPSPSPSHISLISEKPQPPLPTVAPLKPKSPHVPDVDDYKVEVK